MKRKPYLVVICGCKNSGKTTLITRLIGRFCDLGYKVAAIKHDGHEFKADIEGTDTYRYREYGVYGTAIYSKSKFMLVKEQKETTEQELIDFFPEAEILIIEGLKNSKYPKYEIIRDGISTELISNKENLIAIISDIKNIKSESRTLDLNNIEAIVEDILNQMKKDEEKKVRNKLNHFDSNGNALMVDVTDKDITEREAIAQGKILVNEETYKNIREGNIKKGDVLSVARIAGIMATKRTSELIPMCHPLMITKVNIDFECNDEERSIISRCTVKLSGKTGVEIEALTGVNISLLTIYDMCKAIDKSMMITDIHLVEKVGGKSGHFVFSSDI